MNKSSSDIQKKKGDINMLPQSLDKGARLAWYRAAKFGLFIHWGAYSAAGLEASWPIMAPALSETMFGTHKQISQTEYTALPDKFNPVDFNAQEWVRTAQAAGMCYIVFTSKHHDGFCMFDAPGTDYKITRTAFGRDICKELAQACAKVGMPLGFYYSPPDMHHPGYRDTSKPATQNWLGEPKRQQWGEYLDYMEAHIRKLLTDYGKVRILWFDGLTNHAKYDPPRFHKLVHDLSPETLINDRLGDDYDFITPEQFIPRKGIPVRTGRPPSGNDPGGDNFFRTIIFLYKIPVLHGALRNLIKKYGSGDLELTPVLQDLYPSPQRFQPWETCMTMGRSWAYNPDETDWKSPQALIHNLVKVVSRGGNYLLNVGPTDRGTFPPEAVQRLDHVGKWMASNNEAIYGSTYTPLPAFPWGVATRKGAKTYLHVFEPPADKKLEINGFPGAARSVHFLNGEKLPYTQSAQRLEITLPAQAPDPDATVVAVDIDSSEAGWNAYTLGAFDGETRKKYLKTQVTWAAIINMVLNGLIAFFSYRKRTAMFSYPEIAIDVLITVFIIAFLTSWFVIGSVRKEILKGNLPGSTGKGLKLPGNAALRALLLSFVCVIGFGGLFVDGVLFLLAPGGLNNWAYIIIKTLYTGASAAVAGALSIWSVYTEKNRSRQ
jgi:alpha-L-fucosidase